MSPNILWFPSCLKLVVLSFLICNVLKMWSKIRRNMNIRFLLLHLQILVDLAFLPVVWDPHLYQLSELAAPQSQNMPLRCISFQLSHLEAGVFLHYTAATRNTETFSGFRALWRTLNWRSVTDILFNWYFSFTCCLCQCAPLNTEDQESWSHIFFDTLYQCRPGIQWSYLCHYKTRIHSIINFLKNHTDGSHMW